MDLKLKPITAIYPRTFNTSQHMVLYTPFDEIPVAVEKLKRDHRAWVRPEEVDKVLEQVNKDVT